MFLSSHLCFWLKIILAKVLLFPNHSFYMLHAFQEKEKKSRTICRLSVRWRSGLCGQSMCENGVSCSLNHSFDILSSINPRIIILQYPCHLRRQKSSWTIKNLYLLHFGVKWHLFSEGIVQICIYTCIWVVVCPLLLEITGCRHKKR